MTYARVLIQQDVHSDNNKSINKHQYNQLLVLFMMFFNLLAAVAVTIISCYQQGGACEGVDVCIVTMNFYVN